MTARMVLLFLTTLLAAAQRVEAQRPSAAVLVTTLGRDTIAVERFARGTDQLTGETIRLVPRVTRTRYQVGFEGTRIRRVDLHSVVLSDTNRSARTSIRVDADSIRWRREQTGADPRHRSSPSPAEPVFFEELYLWGLYSDIAARVATEVGVGDSLAITLATTGNPVTRRAYFKRRARDTVSTTFFYPEYWMSFVTDPNGVLSGVDGAKTTIKVRATRADGFDLERFTADAIDRERRAGPLGTLSRFDSSSVEIGGTRISLVYGRPSVRGRTIWGGVVPFGEVWRTGADAATRLHVDGPVRLGNVEIPAGSYSLFSLPHSDGTTLIVNRQVGQWGTEYHAERDLARIPLSTRTGIPFVEVLSLTVEPVSPTVATFAIRWGDREWSLPLSVRGRK